MAQHIDPIRLDAVEKLYLDNLSERAIELNASLLFKCSRRAVRKYLVIVKRRLAAQATPHDAGAARVRCEGMLLEAFVTARDGVTQVSQGPGQPPLMVADPDAKGMVAAAKTLGELRGAFPTKDAMPSIEVLRAKLPAESIVALALTLPPEAALALLEGLSTDTVKAMRALRAVKVGAGPTESSLPPSSR